MDKIKFPDKVYNVLKWIIAIVLPACASLYLKLGGKWGWFEPELISETITDVQWFLGVIFAISCYNYAIDQKKEKTED